MNLVESSDISTFAGFWAEARSGALKAPEEICGIPTLLVRNLDSRPTRIGYVHFDAIENQDREDHIVLEK